jgi:transcriptional regulator with GAF, ATPase, and Fis domain
MDVVQAVEFKSGARLARCDDLTQTPIGSPQAGNRKPPLAYVVREDALGRLKERLPGSIIDRGRKHPARPLDKYFTNRSGIVAVRAGYTSAGHAEQAVHSVLLRAAAQHITGILLVGVSEPLFQKLWSRAVPLAGSALSGNQQTRANHYRQILLEQCPPEAVPDELRKAYLGGSEAAENVRRLIVLAARSEENVLIQGETGTGKEIVARQIHLLSGRPPTSFTPLNCGGVPSELLESELFGYMRGAFTGATQDRGGLWSFASGGTLFLDEVGDLSLQHQVKILRALEDGEIRRLGSNKPIEVDARIIAATNRDLARMVADRQFREDLYFRLFTFCIRTPALRENPDDIPLLANHLWSRIARSSARPLPVAVTDALKRYRWPGNVRELKAFLINVFMVAGAHKLDAPLIRGVMQERTGLVQVEPGDQ